MRAILLVRMKTVLPETRNSKSTRPSHMGSFFIVVRPALCFDLSGVSND
ncbi:MAG: hypothetical protein PUC66_07670 [Erysipelotrichaceae bacterium]|nr:hypothetical protein [Erysipelotrichaceae bacterium]